MTLASAAILLLAVSTVANSNPITSQVHAAMSLSLPDPMEVPGLFEGDIVLEDREALPRNAIRNKRKRWPNGVVPYNFARTFSKSEKKVIKKGMKEIEDKTCVRFVERTNERSYVNYMQGNGCYSQVGRRAPNRAQDISLGNRCVNHRTVVHEIMHALGFEHEIGRTDRDEYVTILWDNIKSGNGHNFEKYSQKQIDHLGEEYDFDSVLHYSSSAFSKSIFKSTIRPVKPGKRFGYKTKLSKADRRKINKLYCGLPINPEVTTTESPVEVTTTEVIPEEE